MQMVALDKVNIVGLAAPRGGWHRSRKSRLVNVFEAVQVPGRGRPTRFLKVFVTVMVEATASPIPSKLKFASHTFSVQVISPFLHR